MWNPPNKDSRNSPEFRVVKQVAYAQPVANSQVFYPQQNVGYPFLVNNGRAKVRREHNSECVLYDPAESVVVRIFHSFSILCRFLVRFYRILPISSQFLTKFKSNFLSIFESILSH